MSEHNGYFFYWGKVDNNAYHLLPYHCIDVAAVGRRILQDSFVLSDMARKCNIDKSVLLDWLTFIFAIHDIGKFSNGFQGLSPKLARQLKGKVVTANYQEKHWSIGYRFLDEKSGEIFPGCNRDLLQFWFSASSGHHGRPPKIELNRQPINMQFPGDVENDALMFISELKNLFGVNIAPMAAGIDYYKLLARISWFVAGITTLADWMGSNSEWFPFYKDTMSLDKYYTDVAVKNAEQSVAASRILPASVSAQKSMQELFPFISESTQLQKQAENVVLIDTPQLFIIEEVTGRGKTEAALTLAYRLMTKGLADGIYFGLPTMATANAMHKRVKDVYLRFYSDGTVPSFILAHSASRMHLALEKTKQNVAPEDEKDQDYSDWIANNRKKALLAQVGVGTIDQALLAVLQARHQALRLLGLSRKVLIVDEVHACDDYMHTLLCNLLKFHSAQGGSAILLSATLPINMRKELISSFADGLDRQFQGNVSQEYPLLTQCSTDTFQEYPIEDSGASRSVYIQTADNYKNIFKILEDKLEKGQCVCWVRNTVFDAITVYKDAQSHFGKYKIILFHSRFTLGDRLDIEADILESFGPQSSGQERKGKFVIATQVVEQSLDLDFDFMISDLAPIDLIIQRAGRLCRHNRDALGNRISGGDERGEQIMGIFMPKMCNKPQQDWYKSFFPKAANVYQHHGQLWLTAKWLIEHGKFNMPSDARDMIESVYSDEVQERIPSAFERNENIALGKDGAAASMASFYKLNLDGGYKADTINWPEDDDAPTRLEQSTIMVRLARWDNGKLVPFISKGQSPDVSWELSQVSVYRNMIMFEDETNKEAIDKAKNEMSDKGKYCMVIVLDEHSGRWIGKAKNEQGVVTVYYDKTIGLQVSKGEYNEFDL